MGRQQKNTRREIIGRLAKSVEELQAEQARIAKKLEKVVELLKLLATDPDEAMDGDGFNLDEDVEYDDDNPEYVEFEGVVYKIKDEVQLFDPKKKTWSSTTWVLYKFCNKMAKMKSKRGEKETRHKYGNFHLPE